MSVRGSNSALPNKWLLAALLITFALTLWAFFQQENQESELVELAENRASSPINNNNKMFKQEKTTSLQEGAVDWQQIEREPLENTIKNPFKVHSWLVIPPIKKLKPAPPPLPTAPLAPFTYMGKFEETSATTQFFLMANGKLFSVNLGNNIDTQWRLNSEDANNLHLTYLPLNLPQVLSKTARPMLPSVDPISAEMNL